MTPEFRAGERVRDVLLVCTECGGPAEGDCSWTDGSGELCNACAEGLTQTAAPMPSGDSAAAERRCAELDEP